MKIYWDGKIKNLIGPQVKQLRKAKKLSQKELAEKLQLLGYDFNDLTILRIEQQTRFVSDIELLALVTFLMWNLRNYIPKFSSLLFIQPSFYPRKKMLIYISVRTNSSI